MTKEVSNDSVVVRMNFVTDEGVSSKRMKRGQWVILWGEIPARKLIDDKFMVYPNCQAIEIEKLEKKSQRSLNDLSSYIDTSSYIKQYTEPRYIRQGKKTRRQNYWEPPTFF